jgi:hypothetical protein
MDDLANVIEKVRVDFSVFIDFEDANVGLRRLQYKKGKGASAGFAIGRIRYPNLYPKSPGFTDGYLIYLQSVPISSMPADVESYRRQHPQFPNDPTSDQFFDEQALEAYRELGYAIAGEFSAAVAGRRYSGPYMNAVRKLFSSVRTASQGGILPVRRRIPKQLGKAGAEPSSAGYALVAVGAGASDPDALRIPIRGSRLKAGPRF